MTYSVFSYTIRLMVSLGILLSALPAIAQKYHAVHIPQDKLRDIKLDGNTADWEWVPAESIISIEYLTDIESSSSIDTMDFDCNFIIAWSDIQNWIYIVAIVYDDIRHVDQIAPTWEYWLDDTMEFSVNPSLPGQQHPGELGWFYHGVKSHLSFPLSDTKRQIAIDSGPSWIADKEFVKYGLKTEKDLTTNRFKTIYEMGMPLWDEWSTLGPEMSKRHRLVAGQIMRMSVAFDDIDAVKDKRESQWATFASPDWWKSSDFLSLLVLDPPSSKNPVDEIQSLLK